MASFKKQFPLFFFLKTFLTTKKAELGTRQHCCDKVTMFSGPKIVGHCIITIFVVPTPSRP